MNYIGGKYKLLPQLLPLFPSNISMFYDIFGGGANVSLNVNSEFVLYNDIVPYVSNMFNEIKGEDADLCLNKIKQLVTDYKLSKTNREGFEKMRDDYNKGNKSWDMFFTLMCFSFNNQYRFNNKQEYNSSFGKHKSCFSEVTERKFIKFMDRLNNIDISFLNKDFREVDYSNADENDLVYFDPPYLISCGNYNDGKRGFKGWNQQDDIDLMNLCDKLDEQGTRFAISNVLEHKGLKNELLINWSKKYNINYLNNNYNNCNYQENNKINKTVEVLITNY
ncbi:Dam family site-specific DNA-(adenine-N6)-methyltransferase [Terrisporobacter sp.]|uniref:Dam family site-specific DNA-(adenine-N6)-methyltransferase n=1 Tax=Terrisporobacter sp. TaxID=1965305 RepID=UPI002618E8F0|nr:Dam family site-specific DNA-(adenine-N6)-methyltransferase [Terrisporobacter sp.]